MVASDEYPKVDPHFVETGPGVRSRGFNPASAAKRIRQRPGRARPPVVRAIAVPERYHRPLGRLLRFGNATSRAQRLRTKELRPPGQRAARQGERVDRGRVTREDRQRIRTVGITVRETPLPGRDQGEREQR